MRGITPCRTCCPGPGQRTRDRPAHERPSVAPGFVLQVANPAGRPVAMAPPHGRANRLWCHDDPLSKTTRHWPSASSRQIELNRPITSPDAARTGPELSARSPEARTSMTSGCHEKGATEPSKNGAQPRRISSHPRSGSRSRQRRSPWVTQKRQTHRNHGRPSSQSQRLLTRNQPSVASLSEARLLAARASV